MGTHVILCASNEYVLDLGLYSWLSGRCRNHSSGKSSEQSWKRYQILRGESHLRLETSGECCLASPPPPPPPPPHSFGVTQIDPNTQTHAARMQ